MALQIVKQRQVEGLGSNATLMDQLSNLSKAYQNDIIVLTTGAGQTFNVGTAYEIGGNVLKVYYNGTLQKAGVSYIEVDNYHIQFPDMVYQNDNIVLRIEGAGAGTAFVSDHGHVIREVMTGTIDGTNKVFVTARPVLNGSECVFLNGVLQDSGIGDYTIQYGTPTGKATVTFATAPKATDRVLVNYIYPIAN